MKNIKLGLIIASFLFAGTLLSPFLTIEPAEQAVPVLLAKAPDQNPKGPLLPDDDGDDQGENTDGYTWGD